MQKTASLNRRQHERSVMFKTIEYSVISSSNNDIYYGIISDISVLGMCLLTTSPLKPGEKIKLKSDYPTSQIAIVLWNDIGAFYYKTGLKFV
jgi:PilZ domain-containing protein